MKKKTVEIVRFLKTVTLFVCVSYILSKGPPNRTGVSFPPHYYHNTLRCERKMGSVPL